MQIMPDEIKLDDETSEQPETTGIVAAEPDVVVEKDEKPEPAVSSPDMASLAAENAELKRQLLAISEELKKLKDDKKEKPVEAPKEPKEPKEPGGLDYSQIASLIREHGDNPEVLANIISYVAQAEASRVASKIRDEAIERVTFQQWYNSVKTASDAIVHQLLTKKPDLEPMIPVVAERLALDHHPAGRLSAALLLLHAMDMQNEKKDAVDTRRVEELKTKKSLDKTRGSSGTSKLTKEQLEVANRLGIDPDTYAKFLPKEE